MVATLAVLASGGGALAQQSTNIRGTITGFDGRILSVDARGGGVVAVEVPEAINVAITKPFSLADVKPGMVLGVTTVNRADGKVVAIDVRPIPATANQGLSPHDLAPQSTMTNASVEATAAATEGNELTLNYKSGTVTVLVLPGTAMSQAAPGSRSDLKVGETVFVAARRTDAGGLTAARVQVSKDGVKPTQ
ncbi:MAG: hypothetical protein O9972_62675 [Burkholderiales bacterium]|nr:hypothetical protein [Burkholderiales bacterium]